MLFKRIISIIIILNIYLCYCNVVFAKEVSQNTNEEFYRYTLIYELGHVFTLGHPNASCLYKSIMQPSGINGDDDKKSNEITLHDAYGVYNAYKNPKNRSNINRTREIPKIQILHSEFNTQIKNINDVEDMAQCIVKAKVLESENMPEGGVYTETDIEITDVYKGNLNVGDIVTIVEAYCTTEVGTEMRTDGYSASTPGKEYIFYLGTQFDDGTYNVSGTVFGRYPLDDTQALNEEVDTIEANIIEECVPVYRQIKEDVMNKYNND